MSDVRFIRKRGRIIPIRTKKKKLSGKEKAYIGGASAISASMAKEATKLGKMGLDESTGIINTFHGTSKSAGAKIRKEGLRVSDPKTFSFKGIGEQIRPQSKMTFVSRDKGATKSFSKLAQHASTHGDKISVTDKMKKIKVALFGRKGDVVNMKFTTGEFSKMFERDPETVKIMNSLPSNQQRMVKGNTEIYERFASKDNISNKFINRKFSFKQRVSAFKSNSKSFRVSGLKKMGKSLALAGISAMLAKSAYNVYKGKKNGKK